MTRRFVHRRWLVWLVLTVAGAAILSIALIVSASDDRRLKALRDGGGRTTATVVSISDVSRTGESLSVLVQFFDGRSEFTTELDVSSSDAFGAKAGDTIPIVFDPADPTIAVPADALNRQPFAEATAQIIIGSLVLVGGLALALIDRPRRQPMLATNSSTQLNDPLTRLYSIRRTLIPDRLWFGLALIVAGGGLISLALTATTLIGVALSLAGLAMVVRFAVIRRRSQDQSPPKSNHP